MLLAPAALIFLAFASTELPEMLIFLVHPLNAFFATDDNLPFTTSFVSFLQFANAEDAIFVTPFPSVTDVAFAALKTFALTADTVYVAPDALTVFGTDSVFAFFPFVESFVIATLPFVSSVAAVVTLYV